MSYTTYVYAIVGVHCKDAVTETTKSKSRGCDHPEADTEFCAVCGKKMWVELTIRHKHSDKLEHLQLWHGNEEGDVDESTISMIYSPMCGPSDFVVGKVLEDFDSNNEGVAVPFNVLTDDEYTDAFYQTKAELEPLGLWDQDKFGYLLYAISM